MYSIWNLEGRWLKDFCLVLHHLNTPNEPLTIPGNVHAACIHLHTLALGGDKK